MKGLAKLILFYSITCFVVLIFMALLKFTEAWIDAAGHIPAQSITVLPEILKTLASSLPFSLYASVMMTLSYSVRRNIKAPLTIITLLIFSLGLHIGLSLSIDKAAVLPPASPGQAAATMGSPGLMLNQGNITMVLLGSPSKAEGSRVVSIPGQPLIYQEKPIGPGNTILPLPSAPFHYELPYFLQSIVLDFSLTARYYQALLGRSFMQFIIYSASICLLLCSLRFLFTVSRWPLTNLFLGALVFRGILTLETFLNTRETQELIGSFLGNALPLQYINSLVLAALAVLVLLYTVLAYFARGRLARDE